MSTGNSKVNAVTLALRGKRFTLKAKLFYPHIFQPKQEPNKAPKYSCLLAWDINDPVNAPAVQEMKALFANIKAQFHPTIPDNVWVNPLKNYFTTQRNDGKQHPEYLKGMEWINCSNSTKFAPQIKVKNAQGMIVTASPADEIHAYDGAEVLVSISFFGLNGENARYGVSTNFDVIVLLGQGERVLTGAGGGVNLTEAFGKFADMMGITLPPQGQQQPPQGQQQAPAQQQYTQQPPMTNQGYTQQPPQQPMTNQGYVQQPQQGQQQQPQQPMPGYNHNINGLV